MPRSARRSKSVRREVQPGGRRGHRSRPGGRRGLIALAVRRPARPLRMYGGSGTLAVAREQVERPRRARRGWASQRPSGVLRTSVSRSAAGARRRSISPSSSRPRVWHSNSHSAVGVLAQEQPLPLAAGAGAAAEQAGRQHARVIQHEQVAGREQVGQVGEDVVRDAPPRRGARPSAGTGRARRRAPGRSGAGAGRSRRRGHAQGSLRPQPLARGTDSSSRAHLKFLSHSSKPFLCCSTVLAGPIKRDVVRAVLALEDRRRASGNPARRSALAFGSNGRSLYL